MVTDRAPLLTSRFLVVSAATVCYFLGLNMTLSVLPLFVETDLGGTSTQVGLSVSSFGFAAAIVRPLIGPVGDRRGRRFLLMGGAIVAGLALVATAFATTIPMVIGTRIVAGFGEAAVFVGAATAIQDLAPPDRRGEAASYFSLTIYGSLALAPPLGEFVSETWSTDAVWFLAGALALVAAFIGRAAPGPPAEPPPKPESFRLLHPAALRPGLVLFLGLLGYTGFLTFAAVHAEDVGIANTGTVFTVFAAVVILLRVVGARVPDQLGPVRTSMISLSFGVAGLVTLFIWREPIGVYVGAAIMAVAQTFLFPALFALTVDRAPDAERSHAVSTFSMFFDLAFAIGGPMIGLVADVSDRPTGFLVAACVSMVALVSCRRILDGIEHHEPVAELGPRSRR